MTLIYAHRGLRNEAFLENTLSAFKEAYNIGADGIELDVHLTANDQWIVHHDSTYGKRIIISETSSIKLIKIAYANNQEITFLEEIIKEFRYRKVNIECKPNSFDVGSKLANFLENEDFMASCNISSFHIKTLLGARKTSKDANLSLVGLFMRGSIWKALNKKINLYSINPYYLFTRNRKINEAHKLNVEIHSWTVNKPQDIIRLIRSNVDVIITDKPKLAINLRNKYQIGN